MVQSYLEDSSVSQAAGLGRFGELMASFGRGLSSIQNVLTALPFGGTLVSWDIAAKSLSVGGLSLTFAAPILGALTASGGILKGLGEFSNGKPKKAIKETIKGVAEGAFVGLTALAVLATGVLGGTLILAAGEIISKISTGKTLTAHFGNVVGTVLDATMGKDEFGKNTQQGVNISQAQGMGMQQQMGMAPAIQQPTYGQMMPNGGVAYSAVPAGVGMPQMVQQQAPATYWQDYVAPQRAAQQQEPVMLSGAEAGRYTQAVDTAREAAAMNPNLTNRQ